MTTRNAHSLMHFVTYMYFRNYLYGCLDCILYLFTQFMSFLFCYLFIYVPMTRIIMLVRKFKLIQKIKEMYFFKLKRCFKKIFLHFCDGTDGVN